MALQVIIKTIIAATVGVALLCAPVKADVCITVDSFTEEFAKEGIRFRGSTAAATKRMAERFNANRATNGQPAAEISIFLFGPVMGTSGPAVIAAAVGKDGCIITKTVIILTVEQFEEFMKSSVAEPKDLIPLDGA